MNLILPIRKEFNFSIIHNYVFVVVKELNLDLKYTTLYKNVYIEYYI